MEETKKKPGRPVAKKKYYIGYHYFIKGAVYGGAKIVEDSGKLDLKRISSEIQDAHRAGQCVIVSVLETK